MLAAPWKADKGSGRFFGGGDVERRETMYNSSNPCE